MRNDRHDAVPRFLPATAARRPVCPRRSPSPMMCAMSTFSRSAAAGLSCPRANDGTTCSERPKGARAALMLAYTLDTNICIHVMKNYPRYLQDKFNSLPRAALDFQRPARRIALWREEGLRLQPAQKKHCAITGQQHCVRALIRTSLKFTWLTCHWGARHLLEVSAFSVLARTVLRCSEMLRCPPPSFQDLCPSPLSAMHPLLRQT